MNEPQTQQLPTKEELIEKTTRKQRIVTEFKDFFDGVCSMNKPFEKDDLDTLISKMTSVVEKELESARKEVEKEIWRKQRELAYQEIESLFDWCVDLEHFKKAFKFEKSKIVDPLSLPTSETKEGDI